MEDECGTLDIWAWNEENEVAGPPTPATVLAEPPAQTKEMPEEGTVDEEGVGENYDEDPVQCQHADGQTAKLFNAELRKLGYVQSEKRCWNNRPASWTKPEDAGLNSLRLTP